MREALAESPPLDERLEPEPAGGPLALPSAPIAPAPAPAPAMPRPGLLRRLAEWRSPRRVKVSTALRFYHEVLGLDHLHYGLWNGEAFDLQGLKVAQERFTRKLCEWVPTEVDSVLDVGCGIGSTALALDRAGYAVEGLSPDPYHRDAFSRRVGRPFHLSRFQEFEPERRYDLILMSESAQYVWLDRLFPAVRRAAAPGGHLLVADYFTLGSAEGALARSGHPLDAFLAAATAAGLVLERREDVTDRVAPTLDLARSWLSAYVSPCLAIASESFQGRHPHLARLGRWLLRHRLEQLEDLQVLVDSARFKRHKRYLLLLFRLP